MKAARGLSGAYPKRGLRRFLPELAVEAAVLDGFGHVLDADGLGAGQVGLKIAPWLRHMVRQITIEDFPDSWQEARSEERSHDSCDYDTRFMLRLDDASRTKLQELVERYGASKAEIIRQLIAQATLEDFPNSWQTRAEKRHIQQARQDDMRRDEKSKA